jgi:two-component system LytT family response regulator
MRALVVDDSKPARDRMNRLLSASGVEVEMAKDYQEALSLIDINSFDIAFLDIEMPEVNGLELAQKILNISPNTKIVFATAYSEYALEAFNSGGVGYILKPVDSEKLDEILSRFSESKPTKNQKPLLVKNGRKIYLIELDEVYFFKAYLDEIFVKAVGGEGYIQKRFYELEESIAGNNFFKVHRSIIVNVDKIKSLESIEQSKFIIKFKEIEESVTSSKDGAKKLREYLEK